MGETSKAEPAWRQESALKTLGWDTEELRLEKNNVLLIGPTGCGQYNKMESCKSDINFLKKIISIVRVSTPQNHVTYHILGLQDSALNAP